MAKSLNPTPAGIEARINAAIGVKQGKEESSSDYYTRKAAALSGNLEETGIDAALAILNDFINNAQKTREY